MLRIISWNINSIRSRLELLHKLINDYNPDVLLLQETKVNNADFPLNFFAGTNLKYNYINGTSHYSGVAIFSKHEFERLNIENHYNLESRDIAINIAGISIYNLYVPAGGYEASLNQPKFAEKIAYFKAITEYFSKINIRSLKAIIMGDLNIAPLEEDVWSHKQLLTEVSHTPLETGLMLDFIENNGLFDVPRYFMPEGKLYSWWSYRNKDYKKSNRGRRLDHAFATKTIANSIKNCFYLHEFREMPKPSDHVPLVVDMAEF